MSAPAGLGGVGRALSNRSFRLYFFSLVASTTGFWASRVALAWLVWELTHSPTWLGIIVFVEVVPMLALTPIGGTLVDRTGALSTCRITQLGWAGVMIAFAAIVLMDAVSEEALLIIVFAGGVVNGFSNPSHLALVAKILPRESLSSAVALQSATVQTGRFIGPALAGPILALFGAGIVFAAVAICFAFSGLMLLMTRTLEPEKPSDSARSFMGDFIDGLRYTAGHFAIRTIIVFTAIMALLLRPLVELLPGFVDQVFGRGAEGLAWLLTAFGVGSVISAVYIAFRGETAGLTRVFIIHLVIGALSLFAFAFTTNFMLALALTVIFGMSTNTVSIASQTLAQNAVAGRMRARVMSTLGLTFRGVPALGALIQGWAQSIFGLPAPVAVAAVICLIAWFYLLGIARSRGLARAAENPAPAE